MPLTATNKTKPAFAKVATKPAKDSGKHEVITFPSGEVIDVVNDTPLIDLQKFEMAADQHNFTGKQRDQFIAQSIEQAKNIRAREASNTLVSDLGKQNQIAFNPSKAHVSQARKADGKGVNGVFASYKNVFCFV